MGGKIKLKGKFSAKGIFKQKKVWISLVALVLCVSLTCFFVFRDDGKEEVQAAYVEAEAVIGNIIETIEQSGVIEPLDRYEITSRVKGEIISSPFEEGDVVEEGATLYRIDDEDAQLSIEKAQNNIEKAQMALDDINDDLKKLDIYAPTSGKLTDFSLEAGDSVGNSVVAKIINSDVYTIDIPFSLDDFDKVSVGDKVTLTSALYMTTLEGKVTHKYNAIAGMGTDGSALKNIEIELKNPGALAENTTFAATVHTSSGEVNSSGSGKVSGGTVTSVKSEVGGTVVSVSAKNGDYVKKGQLLVKVKNDSLTNSRKSSELSLKDSRLSMESSRKTLEDYNITAPISGTIITKNSKAGDNIDNSSGQMVMMVIADMSKVKFMITVDELDISDIQLGQTAVVDADALPEESFEAVVTSIASEGVSSGDGVTTYDVELTIDEPGNLKSGMNVNANIYINEARNVISIPEDALMGVRGSKASVLVKTDGKTNNNDGKKTKASTDSDEKTKTEKTEKMPASEKVNQEIPQKSENFAKGEMPSRPTDSAKGKIPQKASSDSGQESISAEGTKNQKENAALTEKNNGAKGQGGFPTPTGAPQSSGSGMPAGGKMNIPEGYEMRQVEIGISDGTNVEIVSGLSEGEIVAYIPTSASSTNPFFRMMHGGMMGGGMMGGGMMGGSRTSGNTRNSGASTGMRR